MLISEMIEGRRCRIIGTQYDGQEGEIVEIDSESSRPIVVFLDSNVEVEFKIFDVEII